MVPPPVSIEFALFARNAAFVFLPGLPAGPMGADACCMVMQSILNEDLFENILAVSPPTKPHQTQAMMIKHLPSDWLFHSSLHSQSSASDLSAPL